ncbi:hypothetical protein QAD02_011116 [Eretmocerus hayati]|uniref:Uncharacterized protein n=1 Tax=Eretmocerus hayati TaxID=131215 RepID=A0ACC2P0L5_9HYME|nr:hypothetical protein QAD02_011116 [Eretmocerus hayati]
MFLILRLFNSIIFVVANISVAIYTLQRFFRAMKTHYQLVHDVEEFSSLVDQSRQSLDFVGSKVMEAMREIESDIGREVHVTDNLTRLSTKIQTVSERFKELEDGIIELARLSHNQEHATVETPSDINEEVRKILATRRRHEHHCDHYPVSDSHCPRQNRQRKSRPGRSHAIPTEPPTNIASSPVQHQIQGQPCHRLEASLSPIKRPMSPPRAAAAALRRANRSKSPVVVPEVTLLNEQRRPPSADKPIGFRPPWMCEV